MRNSALLLGRDLLGIASEMLEILNKIFRIIFNYIFFRVLRVLRGFFGVSVKVKVKVIQYSVKL